MISPYQLVAVVALDSDTLLLIGVRDDEVGRLNIDLPSFDRKGCGVVFQGMRVVDVNEKFAKGFESLIEESGHETEQEDLSELGGLGHAIESFVVKLKDFV
jgi:hypothetical protein